VGLRGDGVGPGHLITLVELIMARLPLPRRLGQIEGLERDRIGEYARLAMLDHCRLTNPRPCTQENLEELLDRAW
jgi:alcohol dehydrogenase class IV